jgi:hypothetical protein
LDSLTVESQFRLRGLEVTRLDTFIDAAFAFVLTLLIISFDEIPSDYAELMAAVKRIPAFACSFVVIMMFWHRHRRWSRRYGLESPGTILLSLALIFVVLVYVYPLRIIFEAMFAGFSNGYLSSSFRIQSIDELRGIFVFYSIGFLAIHSRDKQKTLKENKKVWENFNNLAASYRKGYVGWLRSAKKKETMVGRIEEEIMLLTEN